MPSIVRNAFTFRNEKCVNERNYFTGRLGPISISSPFSFERRTETISGRAGEPDELSGAALISHRADDWPTARL